MSIEPISGGSQGFQRIKNDFQTLGQALKSGNLEAAQKAYDSIQTGQGDGPSPPAEVKAGLDALGKAIASGDISKARDAFADFQASAQAARQSGGPPPGGPPGGSQGGQKADNDDDAAKTIVSRVSHTTANGRVEVTTTYADGSTKTETDPNPSPAVSKTSLDPSNSGQLAALLGVQEQTSGG
jgi:hypothetical protein